MSEARSGTMRAWALWAGCLLSACTRAPAPCGADVDCPAARCVNGACVSDAPPLDGGIAIDGGRLDRGVDPDDGVPRDDGPRDDGPRDDGPRDGGPRDAEPLIDAAPGCEFLMVTVDVDAGALEVRRDEPVELRVTATGGATITYESSAGGAFIDEPTGALWIARDEVDWPWFTDRVSLTVTAELDGCRAQQRVFVTLLGDVLVADVVSGRLDVIGSDGFEFGQWRLVDQSGVSALARMPDGGFVAAIRGPLDERGLRSAPRILRLDANGQEVLRFEPFDLMRAPIFTGQIEHLYVQGERVIAANVADDTIRWFDFEGELRRSVAGGGSWIEALAPRGDDNVAFSRNRETRVFTLDADTPQAIADADEAVYGLFPLSDGGTLMALGINQAELALLTLEGQVRAVTDPPANFSVNGLTAFDDGYLALSRRNNTVIEFGADLELVEDFEFANTGPENPRALVWLHTP